MWGGGGGERKRGRSDKRGGSGGGGLGGGWRGRGGGRAGQIIIKFWEKHGTSVHRRATCSPVQFSMLHSAAC